MKKYLVINFKNNTTTMCESQDIVLSCCGFNHRSFMYFDDFLKAMKNSDYEIIEYYGELKWVVG
jgi:hypothetical protein